METAQGNNAGRWERRERVTAHQGSFTGDQVMLGKDVLTLAWDTAGPLVLSFLLHATTHFTFKNKHNLSAHFKSPKTLTSSPSLSVPLPTPSACLWCFQPANCNYCWFSEVSHWYCFSWSQQPNWEAAGSNFSRVHRGELHSFAHYVELGRGEFVAMVFFHHTFLSLVPSSLLVFLFFLSSLCFPVFIKPLDII